MSRTLSGSLGLGLREPSLDFCQPGLGRCEETVRLGGRGGLGLQTLLNPNLAGIAPHIADIGRASEPRQESPCVFTTAIETIQSVE
jgi:hypothetical protein